MKLLTLCTALGLLAGCASSPQTAATNGPARGKCRADASAWAVGQPANEENGRRVFQESGAGLWRIIAPGQAVRKDYRDDRLTVYVDSANIVTSITCG